MISPIEESDRDWDWFAVDPAGAVGHFTTAGMRVLPKTVRQDKEAALHLIDYFFEKAPKSRPHIVRTEAEIDSGGWPDDLARSQYLKDFSTMASAGVFSYDMPTSGRKQDYFLVAYPQSPLHISELPPEIRELVMRTRSPSPFAESPYIAELDTRNW
jgi:hypothetical protein